MDRVIKISSNQSGSLSASKNLVDFDIPSGMVYDLSKSYMVVHSSIETTDTHSVATGGSATVPAQSGGVGVYNCFLNFDSGNQNYKNKHIVKNVSMYSQRMGMVEDIRRSDVLQFNLDNIKNDVDSKINASYNQISSLRGGNAQKGVRWSPHRKYIGLGTEPSESIDREIRIGLSEVMNSCNNIWDGNKYGNTRIHAELSITLLQVSETLQTTDSLWTDTSDGLARSAVAAAGASASVQSLETTRKYNNPSKDAPFFINQKIVITGTLTGLPTNCVRQITSITHNASKSITLGFDFPFGSGSIASTTSLVMKGIPAATSAAIFDSSELVLYVTEKPAQPQIAFTTYKTEEDSNGSASYNHQYYLESDIQNIFWGSRSSDTQLGFDSPVTTYRIRESGEDKTDRDVKYGSSLHLQRLSRAVANSNMRIKDLSSAVFKNNNRLSHLLSSQASGAFEHPLFMIAETCQVTEMPKLLDVNIVGSGAFASITLFKQLIKIM